MTSQLQIQEDRGGAARPTHRNNGEGWGASPGTQSGEGIADLKSTQQGVEKQPVPPEPQTPPITRFHLALGSPCPPTHPALVQQVPQVLQTGAWRDRLMAKPFSQECGSLWGGPTDTLAPARCRPTPPIMPQGTRRYQEDSCQRVLAKQRGRGRGELVLGAWTAAG